MRALVFLASVTAAGLTAEAVQSGRLSFAVAIGVSVLGVIVGVLLGARALALADEDNYLSGLALAVLGAVVMVVVFILNSDVGVTFAFGVPIGYVLGILFTDR